MQQFFAPCPRGLERLLADEMRSAGGDNLRVVHGGVHFSGSLETCYRANLESRLATRILRLTAHAPYRNENDIYTLAANCPWPDWFNVTQTIRVYVTAQKSPLKSLEFVTLRVKDAICDRFRDDCGKRPSVDTRHPQVRIHLFVSANDASIYLDTSGEPLYQRGHKIARVEAPLKENLAAGILRLAGWQPGIPLFDPMCGSGSFLLEAAQISLNDAPGLSRHADSDFGHFSFTRLNDFDAVLWKRLQTEAAQRRSTATTLPIWGADIATDAVARSRQNLDYAGINDLVTVKKADILTVEAPAPSGILVTNPPYGERIGEAEALAAFYPQLGNALKRNFAGWRCYLLSSDTRLPKLIGLQASKKTPLYNGALECRLYEFIIVAGSHRKSSA